MFKNVASQKFRVFAFDSATGLPKSGDAANLTAYVSKDYGTVTVLGDTSATEEDATNAKGYYLFDATQAETNADVLMVSGKSSTSGIVVVGAPAVIATYPTTGILAPATAGRTLVVDASGLADANAVKVGPSGSGTAQTARDIGASVLLSSGTGTGQLNFTSGVVQSDAAKINGVSTSGVTTVSAYVGSTGAAVNGTNVNTLAGHDPGATLGTSTLTQAQVTGGAYAINSASFAFASALDLTATQKTSVTTAATAATPTAAAVTGAVGSVTGNVGGNVTGSVASVATGGITSASFAAGAITASAIAADAIGASELAADAVAEIAAGVWDLATSGHTTSGTFGAAAVAAGGSGDPWSTSLPGSYGAGTAGYIIGNNLNATVSSRSTYAGGDTSGVTTLLTRIGGSITISGGKVAATMGASDYTGNTVQTGDAYARLGAPAGASVSADVAAVKTDTGNLVTRITSTLFSGITSLAQWLGLLAGQQAGNSTALTEIRATGAGSGTFDPDTDSLEAVRGQADAVYTAQQTTMGTQTVHGAKLDSIKTDTAAVLDDTGTSGVVVASASKTGYSLAAAGMDSVVIETGLNARQSLSVIAAALTGVLSGAAGTAVTIKGAGVATTRVAATVDADGNRSAVTLNLPT